MMLPTLLLSSYLSILLFLTTNTNGEVEQHCDKENEQFTTCASSTCFEDTCEDVLFPKPMVSKKCTKDCRVGCQCKPGYYRNHDDRCVNELTCIMCGYEEDWAGIGGGDDNRRVEKTCIDITTVEEIDLENEQDDLDSSPRNCICSKDHYRSKDGLCLSEESCRECSTNEIYQPCGSSSCWEYKCKDVSIPLRERLRRFCTLDCRQGCKCHDGFYRDEVTGECVSAEICLA